jgi:hypothetical protein
MKEGEREQCMLSQEEMAVACGSDGYLQARARMQPTIPLEDIACAEYST